MLQVNTWPSASVAVTPMVMLFTSLNTEPSAGSNAVIKGAWLALFTVKVTAYESLR